MSLKVTNARKATEAEWDAVWRSCSYATYFHSPGWAAVWAEYSCGRIAPAPIMLRLSDGCRALLPFSRQRLAAGLATRVLSSPGGTYGGWIADHRLLPEHARAIADWTIRRYRHLAWRQNPYAVDGTPVGTGWQPDHTRILDLSDGLAGTVRRWTKGHRSAVSKAVRSQVIIRPARDQADWDSYYGAYQDSLRRWGNSATSRYSRDFFAALYRRSCCDDDVKLWLATLDDHVIAGAICLYGSTSVVYWHGAALAAYFPLRPVHLLLHDIVREAISRNLRWFDFNPSGGHDSVEHFKAGFAAERKKASILDRKPLLYRALHTARNRWNTAGVRPAKAAPPAPDR